MPVVLPGAGPVVPGFHTGIYYCTPGTLSTSNGLGFGTLRLSPFWVPRTATFDTAGLEVTGAGTAGNTFRPAVYDDDGTGYPNRLLLDPGTLSVSAIANPTLSITLILVAGLYWIGGAVQGATTQPTVRALASSQALPNCGYTSVNLGAPIGYQQAAGGSGLPAFFTTTAAVSTVCARLLLRAA